MHIAAEVDQRLLHLLLTEKIAHAVSDIAFGDRPEIQLHPRLLEKHAAGCLIKDHLLWAGQRQSGSDLSRVRHAVPVKTNSPQLHQRADGEVKGAVAHHAGGFGALDQLKDRSADGDRMTPGGMVDIHHLRLGAVNGEQVFVALDKLENAGGHRLIVGTEFEQDGRAHQHGGVAIDAVIGHRALLRRGKPGGESANPAGARLQVILWHVSPPDGPRGYRR